ncbi:MAG: phosphotransferase family protein, partial [candidate division WOR-3 bacterium]
MPIVQDLEKLKQYLAEKLGGTDLEIVSEWKNIEGWSMETFSLGLRYKKDGQPVEQEIIIRKEPVSGLLEPYDVSIEYRVLKALQDKNVAVPRVYWYEENPDILGLPFYVMEKVDGVILRTPDQMAQLSPADARRCSDELVDVLVAIHAVDHEAVGLA